jgi:hypothetical protein
MSGSNMVAIVTPIVTLPLMAFWLIMVFQADRHPGYRYRPPLPEQYIGVTAGAHPEVPPQQAGELADARTQAAAGAPDAVRRGESRAGR